MITRSKQMAEDEVKIELERVNEQTLIFTPPLNIVLTVKAIKVGRDLDANEKCICYYTQHKIIF